MDFSSLPLKLKVLIFLSLPTFVVFCKVLRVCREWREVAACCVQNVIKIDRRFHLHPGSIAGCLNHFHSATEVELRDIDIGVWVGHLNAVEGYNFTKIKIIDCEILEMSFVATLLRRFTALREIHVKNCFATRVEENYSSNIVQLVQETCIEGHLSLESIKFDKDCVVTSVVFQTFLDYFRVTLHSIRCNASRLKWINYESLPMCPNLRVLELFNVRGLTRSHLEYIGSLGSLVCLSLTGSKRLSSQALREFFDTLRFPNLRRFSMNACENFDDTVLRSLSETYVDLISVDISFCKEITLDGVEFMSTRMTNLIKLNLAGDENITTLLLTSMRKDGWFSRLRKLNLSHIQVVQPENVHAHNLMFKETGRKLKIVCKL